MVRCGSTTPAYDDDAVAGGVVGFAFGDFGGEEGWDGAARCSMLSSSDSWDATEIISSSSMSDP